MTTEDQAGRRAPSWQGASALLVRVYFEDTDFSGRVYHGAYVRFLERGRTEHLRALGLDHKSLAAEPVPLYFTLRKLELWFRGPAAIDDLLRIETAVTEGAKASFRMVQRIVLDGAPIVEARVELCVIDGQGRPRRPPARLAEALSPDLPRRRPVEAATTSS